MAKSTAPIRQMSWKQSAAARKAGSPESKTASRWGFTLLAIALVVMLAWLIFRPTEARTYFVKLPVTAYERLSAPPIPYINEDFAPLAALESQAILQPKNLSILQNSQSIEQLPVVIRQADPQQRQLRKKDVVLVYVKAHGVSPQGQAMLLCSDFSVGGVSARSDGVVAAKSLFDQIAATEATTKLVLLDVGRLQYDPRIGLVDNDFYSRLDADLRDVADPGLWVLTSAGPLESPHDLHFRRQSLFGLAVAEALGGAADSKELNRANEDDKVSLAELYRYVSNRLADWHDPNGPMAQLPLLFRGGVGLLPEYEERRLEPVFVLSLKEINDRRRKAEAAEKKAAEAARKEAEQAGTGQRSSDADSTATAAARATPRVARLLAGRATPSLAWQDPAAGAAPPAATPPAATGAAPPTGSPPPTGAAGAPPSGAPPGDTASGDTATAPPAATPAAAAPDVPPLPAARAQLLEAWRARDALEDRGPAGLDWTPADFAPQLWRLMNQWLVDAERRLLTADGALDKQDSLLQSQIEALVRLRTAILNDAPADVFESSTVAGKLVVAWNAFRNSPHRASFAMAAPDQRELVRARLRYHDLLVRAQRATDWHHRGSLTAAGSLDALKNPLTALIVGLTNLARRFDGSQPYGADSGSELVGGAFSGVNNSALALDRLVQGELNTALADPVLPTNQRRLDDLLSTALLDAADRARVLAALWDVRHPDTARKTDATAHLAPRRLQPRGAAQRLLRDRVELDLLWVGFVDATTRDTFLRLLPATADGVVAPTEPPTEAVETPAGAAPLAAVGESLASFYAVRLPTLLREAVAGDESQRALARRALWVLDPRDAFDLQLNFEVLPEFKMFQAPSAQQLAVELSSRELQLRLAEPQRLEVNLRDSAGAGSVATLQFTYRADLFQLRDAATDRPINPGQPIVLDLLDVGGRRGGGLAVMVHALKDRVAAGLADVDLDVRVAVDDREQRMRLGVYLPHPNRVDLVIRRVAAAGARPDEGDLLTMRPFPNRETGYRLTLRNHTGETKRLNARLIAAPPVTGATWAPGWMFDAAGQLHAGVRQAVFDAEGRLLPDAKVVAQSPAPLALPATSNQEVEVALATPAPPMAAPAVEGGAVAAPPPPEPANVTHGLVLVLEDADDPRAAPWIKWLEIRPLRPSDYLSCRVYYAADQRIMVELKPRDDVGDNRPDLLPLGLGEKPIEIRWDVAAAGLVGFAQESEKSYRGEDPTRPITLYSQAPPNGLTREVQLTVDGYPRAFVYTVECRPPGVDNQILGREFHQSLNRIRVTRLWMPSENYQPMFFLTPDGQLTNALEEQAAAMMKRAVALRESARPAAYFPATRTVFPRDFEEILAAVEVDIADDAFRTATAGADVIEFGLEGRERQLYADRAMRFRLLGVDTAGLVRLETEVSDYALPLDIRGVNNERRPLVSRVVFGNEEKSSQPLDIIIDDQPPALRNLALRRDPNKPVFQGERLEVTVVATDVAGSRQMAGVDRVEFVVDTTGQQDWGKLEPKIDRDDGRPRADNVWSQTLDTKDLDPNQSYDILVRAWDKVGLSPSATLRLPVTILEQPPEPKPSERPFNGVVEGYVHVNNRRVISNVMVTLEGSGLPPVTAGADGAFKFTGVPRGTYRIVARGTFQGTQRIGLQEGVTPADADAKPPQPRMWPVSMVRPSELPQPLVPPIP